MLAGELGLIDLGSTPTHLLLHFCTFPRLYPVLICGDSLFVHSDVLCLSCLTIEHGVGGGLALSLFY